MTDRIVPISVLMSVYNGERYLSVAIESVLEQTFSEFEFVIIDDGSTDNSLRILRSYADRDSRLRIISKHNTGLADSLRYGVQLSKGAYIARMDQDDICSHSRLETQKAYLDRNPEIGWCCSRYDGIDEGGRVRRRNVGKSMNNCEIKWLFLWMNIGHHPTAFFRRGILKKENLNYEPDMDGVEDFDLWVRLAQVTDFGFVNKSLLKYRDHSGSMTREQAADDRTTKHVGQYLGVLIRSRDQYGLKTSVNVARELAVISGQTGVNPLNYRYRLSAEDLKRLLNDTQDCFLKRTSCTEITIQRQKGLQLLEWARNTLVNRPGCSLELLRAAVTTYKVLILNPRLYYVLYLALMFYLRGSHSASDS